MRKNTVRTILIALMLGLAFASGCGEPDAGQNSGSAADGGQAAADPVRSNAVGDADIRRIHNGYDTVFVSGKRIEHPADTSTSTVADFRREPAARAGKDLKVKETSLIYSRSEHTDGRDKGKPLDLHMILKRDAKAEEKPVVLFVPGGGFLSCRIENKYENVHRYLIRRGFAVAVMEYHVVGQGRYMDAAADVRQAINWLKENGGEYGLKTDRIFLIGNSGGGYLAALTACRDPADIACVVNFYGLCDIINTKADYDEAAIAAQYQPNSSDSQFVNGVYSGKSLTDDPGEAERANPVHYVDGNEPPFLHFHGDQDLWVSPSQTLHLHEALLAAGEETTRYVLKGEGHGSAGFRTEQALDIAVRFMERYR